PRDRRARSPDHAGRRGHRRGRRLVAPGRRLTRRGFLDSRPGMAPRLAAIVQGEHVTLAAPARGPFVDRWPLLNDPELAMSLGAVTSSLSRVARVMPPIAREQREA